MNRTLKGYNLSLNIIQIPRLPIHYQYNQFKYERQFQGLRPNGRCRHHQGDTPATLATRQIHRARDRSAHFVLLAAGERGEQVPRLEARAQLRQGALPRERDHGAPHQQPVRARSHGRQQQGYVRGWRGVLPGREHRQGKVSENQLSPKGRQLNLKYKAREYCERKSKTLQDNATKVGEIIQVKKVQHSKIEDEYKKRLATLQLQQPAK